MLGSTSWADVVIALIAATPGILAAVFAFLNHRAIKLPSGGKIGPKVEQTHELVAVGVAQNTAMMDANGVHDPAGDDASKPGG